MKILLYTTIFCFLSLSALSSPIDKELKKQAAEYRQEGYKLQSKGNIREAFIYYQKAAEIYPQYAEVYNDMGVVYDYSGNKKKSEEMYKKALSINPDYLSAYTNLALLYESEGNLKEAAVYWFKRYRKGRKGEYWREKAKERLELGAYPELYKEVLKDEADVLYSKIAYKREQKRIRDIKEANLHFDKGQELFKKKDYINALKELNTAISLSSSDKELQMKISDMYIAVKHAYTKQEIKDGINNALAKVNTDDYSAAEKELKRTLNLMLISHFLK